MKLYRYRPLSNLLFKELYYGELYFASPMELNDPLDLNAQLSFYSNNENDIKGLVHYLSMKAAVSQHNLDLFKPIMDLTSYGKLGPFIIKEFSNCSNNTVTKSHLFELLVNYFGEYRNSNNWIMQFDFEAYFSSLELSFTQFLNNSSVICFSESKTDFLMWSHYASGHTGICLEFEMEESERNMTSMKFPLAHHIPVDGELIKWTKEIKKVEYKNNLTRLNFSDFLPVFLEEGDIDLEMLSKSYWHSYAKKIEKTYLEKLVPWSSEKEWRMLQVYFRQTHPEDRIIHYDKKALSGVIFGARSSEKTIARVRNILGEENQNLDYYNCYIDGSKDIKLTNITNV